MKVVPSVFPFQESRELDLARRAFDATMTDPAFVADAKRMEMDIDPLTGEQTQALITEVHQTTPAAVIERVRRSLDAGN